MTHGPRPPALHKHLHSFQQPPASVLSGAGIDICLKMFWGNKYNVLLYIYIYIDYIYYTTTIGLFVCSLAFKVVLVGGARHYLLSVGTMPCGSMHTKIMYALLAWLSCFRCRRLLSVKFLHDKCGTPWLEYVFYANETADGKSKLLDFTFLRCRASSYCEPYNVNRLQ